MKKHIYTKYENIKKNEFLNLVLNTDITGFAMHGNIRVKTNMWTFFQINFVNGRNIRFHSYPESLHEIEENDEIGYLIVIEDNIKPYKKEFESWDNLQIVASFEPFRLDKIESLILEDEYIVAETGLILSGCGQKIIICPKFVSEVTVQTFLDDFNFAPEFDFNDCRKELVAGGD